MTPRFYDFFAGAGLVTLALRSSWQCVWANDVSPGKAAVYTANFGAGHFHLGDVGQVASGELPKRTEMAWASFPCQDLSLAGWRRGLDGERSGVFWAFWRIMRDLATRGERPPVIAVENVTGLLYGDSFSGLCEAMASLGMQLGALVIDARRFVPQSRPRVFLIAVDAAVECSRLTTREPSGAWSPPPLLAAHRRLLPRVQQQWRWWTLPVPEQPSTPLERIIEPEPSSVDWHAAEETRRLLDMMTVANREKVCAAQRAGGRHVGFLYKRIRAGVQRAEVRFDGVAGCLRTPGGGSSRQTVVVVDDGSVRTRLLSPREAARLMGAPDSFRLPGRYNDAYKAMGDGVVVPVVSWLSDHLLVPLASAASRGRAARAAAAGREAAQRR